MATLKLNKKAAAPAKKNAEGERRAPLRGKGVSRPRQTLEAAQAERARKQAEFEQRRAAEAERFERYGRPTPRPDERGPDQRPARPAKPSGFRRDDQAPPLQGPRRDGPAAEARRPPRPDQRQDQRQDGRQDQRQDRRQDQRQDLRQDQRQDQRRASGARPPYPAPPQRGPQPAARPRPPARRPHDDDDDDDDFAVHHDASTEGERLSKRMTALGMASRREADEWIGAGWVKVDGKLAQLGQRVGPDVKIEVDPRAFKEQAKQVTILLNKPIGYVSGQAEDGYEPASVLIRSANHWKDDASGIKYHIGHSRGLAPAGRLDIDSTGLLVLTQDGRVAKLLIGDDSKVEKEYLVRVEYKGKGAPMAEFPAQDLALLNHGLTLDDVELKPAKVSWINDDQLRFVLREGRKRQIRRMCELVGLKVVGLKRVRIGRINLGHLPPGQFRFLSPWERFD
ncbi:pseudouridine synthase [Roseateles violae]|uniref:Dual-specificity RNA pseudouridine synthase RluF n=1 Tax=Roseateles violae TaxID=3058042 RepID=A0ABT8DW48_9BURK|nr:pseudouridine synthase [Pelomonas sp. PFR6]MDN3920612.1 pseudouridine synthase [Pelomonas sp. PFR6]